MDAGTKHGGRRGVPIAAAVTVLLTGLGAALLILGLGPTDAPAPAREASATTTPTPVPAPPPGADKPSPGTGKGSSNRLSTGTSPGFGSFLTGSPPVGLDIPSIDVHSTDIVDLGLHGDGSIEVPQDASAPGWFTPGPSPGQLGPAVIAGHVDSATGPAVFYRLGQLRPGDRVDVARADGTVAAFSIDRVATYEKDEFPTRDVYGATTRAELRLITCSGEYDADTGYDSNTVAYAHLI
jgi:hypothetical protein